MACLSFNTSIFGSTWCDLGQSIWGLKLETSLSHLVMDAGCPDILYGGCLKMVLHCESHTQSQLVTSWCSVCLRISTEKVISRQHLFLQNSILKCRSFKCSGWRHSLGTLPPGWWSCFRRPPAPTGNVLSCVSRQDNRQRKAEKLSEVEAAWPTTSPKGGVVRFGLVTVRICNASSSWSGLGLDGSSV